MGNSSDENRVGLRAWQGVRPEAVQATLQIEFFIVLPYSLPFEKLRTHVRERAKVVVTGYMCNWQWAGKNQKIWEREQKKGTRLTINGVVNWWREMIAPCSNSPDPGMLSLRLPVYMASFNYLNTLSQPKVRWIRLCGSCPRPLLSYLDPDGGNKGISLYNWSLSIWLGLSIMML